VTLRSIFDVVEAAPRARPADKTREAGRRVVCRFVTNLLWLHFLQLCGEFTAQSYRTPLIEPAQTHHGKWDYEGHRKIEPGSIGSTTRSGRKVRPMATGFALYLRITKTCGPRLNSSVDDFTKSCKRFPEWRLCVVSGVRLIRAAYQKAVRPSCSGRRQLS
jgi:hypothetical protein